MNSLATDAIPLAETVEVSATELIVQLRDGRRIAVPLDWFPRLLHATSDERRHYIVIGGGYAVHWPDMDEDIRIGGLLEGQRSGESKRSFDRWLQGRREG